MRPIVRAWLRVVSWLVPAAERGEWREEWGAELASGAGALRDAWGALPDAWYLGPGGWTMEGVRRDVGLAIRGLARKPFFSALAGLTLAMGIGANTAIFSVVDAVLLDPLPYPESDRVLSVNFTAPGMGVPLVPHSEGTYLHYLEGFRTMESFAVFTDDNLTLVSDASPERLRGARVTQGFLDVLGVHPLLGRGFAAGDDRPGAEPVAVLSHAVWEQSFGSDPAVVGSLQELDGVRRRVVGVMPPGFSFPEGASVWVPLEIDPVEPDPGAFSWLGIGRLRPGETPASAQADMAELLRRFAEANPDELSPEVLEQAGLVPDARPLKELYVQDMARALWVLLGTVGFVLLIAVANVANLFLVRAEARMREQAVRTALGASRRDMVRLYLAESVALAAGGGILGLGLATAGVRGLLSIAPVAVPRSTEIGIDGSVLAFTAVVSVLSGLLFGLFPVLGYARDDLSSALREGGRSATAGRKRHRARGALVVSQIALALVLLVGSGLMARSFLALRSVDPGFDAQGRLAFRVSLPSAEYPDAEAGALFHARLLERMAAIPGVESVALASALPLEETKNAGPMESEDRPIPENELGPVIDRRLVSPGYFGTMGIGLEGRELTREDRADGMRAVVVSRALARLLWPEERALGKRLRSQGVEDGWWEVVGVAEDVHFESLGAEPAPLLYVPMVSGRTAEPTPSRSFQVVLKVAGNPVSFTAAAGEALREVDPRLPMVEPRAVEGIVRDAMAATSFTVVLLGIAAAIALVLGTVGIYGVVSYVVSRRTAEIGVRMALGAPAARVLREVVGQGATLASAGIAVGLLGAWGVSRVLSSLLYGVTATDPLTYAGTAALLVLVALLASWIPARRASRIDPVEALRAE